MFIGVKRTDDYGIFYNETFYLLFIPIFSSLYVLKLNVGFIRCKIYLLGLIPIWER